MNYFEIVLFILLFGAILFLAYVSTKIIGTKTSNSLKGKYIKIVETVNLGMDKKLHLVSAGDEYFLVASTSKDVRYLGKIELRETPQEYPATMKKCNPLFKDCLQKLTSLAQMKQKQNGVTFSNEK